MTENQSLPRPIPGFEHVNRYWDKRMNLPAAKIMPGEFYVSKSGEMIVTVLGSCISACIRDVQLGIGGMNHFMLPEQGTHSSEKWGSSEASSASRYGNWAMEFLINEILKLGGTRRNLEIKVFGGGNVLANMTDIGERNIAYVRKYIYEENFELAAEDVGDCFPRKVLYFPDTGSVKVRKLRETANDTLIERERNYSNNINDKSFSSGGGVELFD
jgi:chemotaxis protein CheD